MTRLAHYLADLQRFGIAPGLERIAALLARAGDPYTKYPHLLIGGTNGKGSTAEFAACVLAQNGRRVGLYTSPHLYAWNERIRVLPGQNSQGLFEGAISDADLDELLDDAMPHIEAVARELRQPTEFEVMTFLGLWHFARQGVDAAVLEVGLGGKWDATNASDPRVSCVTHVALDHCDRLGNTLEAIAADKVCIARPNRPLVTAETKANVLAIFEEHCQKIGAPLVRVPVAGEDFQTLNAQLALEVAQTFAREIGWELPDVMAQSQVPGRFETISQHPRVILDGANNPDGATHLANHLRALLESGARGGDEKSEAASRLILVLGILEDKDWRAMIAALSSLAHRVIATQSGSPRAALAAQVALEAREYVSNVETIVPVSRAVERALQLARAQDVVCVCGSFYTVAEVDREAVFSWPRPQSGTL